MNGMIHADDHHTAVYLRITITKRTVVLRNGGLPVPVPAGIGAIIEGVMLLTGICCPNRFNFCGTDNEHSEI